MTDAFRPTAAVLSVVLKFLLTQGSETSVETQHVRAFAYVLTAYKMNRA